MSSPCPERIPRNPVSSPALESRLSPWLRAQPNFAVLEVDYNAMMQNPDSYIGMINQFIDNALDEEAMAKMINPNLYRNRA